jgi:hypothetical protein
VEHELLDAISTCKDSLQLPLSFEVEHIPYQLVCSSAFNEDEPIGMTKAEFLKKYIGPEKFAKIDAAIAKWSEEKGIPMYVPVSLTSKPHFYLEVLRFDQFLPWRNEPFSSGT